MIKPYDVFIEETRKENPDMFETLGEDYFKKFYEIQVKVEADYKRIKKAFVTARLYGTLIDLHDVDIGDTKTLVERAKAFGENLALLLSDGCYDALYACPEMAAFMMLSPLFKRADKVEPVGVYKFSCFGTGNCQTVDCYKAPSEVAEKDFLLLHTKDDTWLKAEVNISEFYKRKVDAEREKAKNTLCFDRGIDFGKRYKSAIYEDFEPKQVGEVYWTKENNAIREAMQKILNFIEVQSNACNSEDIDSIVAWDTLYNDFYEEFFSSGRYNDFGKERK